MLQSRKIRYQHGLLKSVIFYEGLFFILLSGQTSKISPIQFKMTRVMGPLIQTTQQIKKITTRNGLAYSPNVKDDILINEIDRDTGFPRITLRQNEKKDQPDHQYRVRHKKQDLSVNNISNTIISAQNVMIELLLQSMEPMFLFSCVYKTLNINLKCATLGK